MDVTVCLLVFSKGNNGRTKWKIMKSIVCEGKKSRGRGSEVGPNTSYLIVLTLEPTIVYNSKQNKRISKMVQWIKVLATRLDYLTSICRTQMVDKEKQLSSIVLCSPRVCCGICAPTHVHTQNKCM